MTAIARYFSICMGFSFPLRHPSIPFHDENPTAVRSAATRAPRQVPLRVAQTYGQEEACASATKGLTRFNFWTGVWRFVRARMRHAEVQPVLPRLSRYGSSRRSMDAPHRPRDDSRESPFQRDRARAARNLAIAARVASAQPR